MEEGSAYGLSVKDWNQIQEWNCRCLEPSNFCLHDLIHQRAQIQPESIAICAWDGQMTYREFDDCTSQLAFWLGRQGVRQDDRVPVKRPFFHLGMNVTSC